jgi:hypothetical protein
MTSQAVYTPVKILAIVVLLLLLGAVLYAGFMAITYWTGIGV